jgi:nicotinamide riboside kinase
VIRVVLTGPEASGKTTLAATLAEHFGAPWTPEA